jgi:bifunctional DNA-binding transcriptional regulator/antitoxin component of YhaV-PrlF toxin-antitoxin module
MTGETILTRPSPSRYALASERVRPRNPDILIFGMAATTTIQIRGRGTLTLPASLREKYRLGEGDPLTVVDLDGAVLLSPRLLVVPRLAAEMERLRRARKLSLKDLGGPARED